jgi:hypothetical protein
VVEAVAGHGLLKIAMVRFVVSLLVSFALVFGTAAAQARPHHPMPAAAMHSSDHDVMPMEGCIHGKPGHKGAPCPMLSCFPSVPLFLTPAKLSAPLPIVHGSTLRVLPTDTPTTGTLSETDPPVPRPFSM